MWIKILNACDKRVIKYAEYCSIYNTSPVSSAVPCLHFAVSFSETWCCYLHILSAIVLATVCYKSGRAGRHPSIQKLPDPPHKEKQIYSKCGNRGSVRWKRHCEGLSKGKDLLKEEHGVPPASGAGAQSQDDTRDKQGQFWLKGWETRRRRNHISGTVTDTSVLLIKRVNYVMQPFFFSI